MQKTLSLSSLRQKQKRLKNFGKDFKVLSSYGHIRDLKKKEFSNDVDKNLNPIMKFRQTKGFWSAR